MPQLSQILATYASQAFWLLIVFAIIYFVIARGMLTKVGATVDARAKKIADDLAEAERAKAAAEAAEATYLAEMNGARGEAGKIAAEAKSRAAADTDAKVKTADTVAAQKIAEAETRISVAKTEAMGQVAKVAQEAASAILGKLGGGGISDADVAIAVQAALRR
jgi:F-type H+-transporting ATPase subunit b